MRARLEFMLTSIAFAVGIASVPMSACDRRGRGAGATDRLDRGWSHLSRSLIATVIAIFPDLWSISSPTTPACARHRNTCIRRRRCTLHRAVDLDVFSSQGPRSARSGIGANRAAAVRGPRRWWLLRHEATAANFFALAAASMVVLGTLSP